MSKKHYNITAIIYDKKGNILSIGKNDYQKTHPLQAKTAKKVGQEHRIYLHAEIAAIVRCKHLDKAHSIYVFKYNTDGTEANAMPCEVCQEALRQVGIKNVNYT